MEIILLLVHQADLILAAQSTCSWENLVTGTTFLLVLLQTRVSTGSQGAKITISFTSDLPMGTHLFLQDVDRQEGWTIVFKNSSGTIDPSGFTPLNVSTTNLPATYTPSSGSLYFKSTQNTNRSEPLVGVVINSSSVRSIELTLTVVAQQTK